MVQNQQISTFTDPHIGILLVANTHHAHTLRYQLHSSYKYRNNNKLLNYNSSYQEKNFKPKKNELWM